MRLLKNRKIYLDYAAATQIDRKVLKEMVKCEKEFFANPNSIHKEGVKAKKALDEARLKIARLINAHPEEIIFTDSGSESDALAILGIVRAYKERGIPHIITTTIEHSAVLRVCHDLEKKKKAEVTYVSVEENGVVNMDELRDSLKENTVLVSVMYANNEIGTIQPIEEIAKIIRHYKNGKRGKQNPFFRSSDEGGRGARPFKNDFAFPFFHTDATQAMNYLFVENVEKLGVDLLSFNSSKIYGPKGIGVLYKKRGVELEPLYPGGEQEFDLQSGTENIASIVGVAKALEITCKMKEKEKNRLTKIRDYAITKLLKLSENLPYKIVLNGDPIARLPNNINISISGVSSELLVIELDAKGIMISEKSACKSDDPEFSHVIKAIRKTHERKDRIPENSLRISLGRATSTREINTLISALEKILSKYKDWK